MSRNNYKQRRPVSDERRKNKKDYIPSADWSDWGILCFDTNAKKDNNNYPVVLWDHEIEDEFQKMYDDFYNLIVKLDKEEPYFTTVQFSGGLQDDQESFTQHVPLLI